MPPTLPTLAALRTEPMPSTIVQKMIGVIIILIRFTNPVPSGLSPTANPSLPGNAKPTAMPSSAATITAMYSHCVLSRGAFGTDGGFPADMELGGDAAAELDMLILLDLTSEFPMTVAPFHSMVNVAFIAFAARLGSPAHRAGDPVARTHPGHAAHWFYAPPPEPTGLEPGAAAVRAPGGCRRGRGAGRGCGLISAGPTEQPGVRQRPGSCGRPERGGLPADTVRAAHARPVRHPAAVHRQGGSRHRHRLRRRDDHQGDPLLPPQAGAHRQAVQRTHRRSGRRWGGARDVWRVVRPVRTRGGAREGRRREGVRPGLCGRGPGGRRAGAGSSGARAADRRDRRTPACRGGIRPGSTTASPADARSGTGRAGPDVRVL